MRTKGINHLALVCRDMRETVKFYTEVLDMPLIKTIDLPDGGQHFFFDCGGGNAPLRHRRNGFMGPVHRRSAQPL